MQSVQQALFKDTIQSGVSVIEASAGTGKTYTLALLILRLYLRQGVALNTIYAVTFTRAAVAELSLRIQHFVQHLLQDLNDYRNQQLPQQSLLLKIFESQEIDAHWNQLLYRLQQANLAIDCLKVTTLHGFLQQFVGELFWLSDVDKQSQLRSSQYWQQHYLECLQVFWLKQAQQGGEQARLFIKLYPTSQALARAVPLSYAYQVRLPAGNHWDAVDSTDQAGLHYYFKLELICYLQQAMNQHSRDKSVVSFDILLHEALKLSTNPQFVELFRQRVRALFVDEFQDTDFLQWSFIKNSLIEHNSDYYLYLIGDPKQSIYRFRNADLDSYFKAIKDPAVGQVQSLTINYRSDQILVEVLNQLYTRSYIQGFDSLYSPFENQLLSYQPVAATQVGSNWSAPNQDLAAVSLRIPAQGLRQLQPDKVDANKAIAYQWLVDDIQALLSTADQITIGDNKKPLQASDLLILVDTNKQVNEIQRQLLENQIAVNFSIQIKLADTAAVFYISGFLRALEALIPVSESLEQQSPAESLEAYLSFLPYLGHDPDLWQADSTKLQPLLSTLANCRLERIWLNKGPYALWQCLHKNNCLGNFGLSKNKQRSFDYEMHDLLHWLQSQWRAKMSIQQFMHAILPLLQQDTNTVSANDASGVRILTVHNAKGLEAAVVFYPLGWTGRNAQQASDYLSIDEINQGYALERQAQQKSAQERHRRLYVALTRAQSKLIIYWLPTSHPQSSNQSPLNHLLFADHLAVKISEGRYDGFLKRLLELGKIENLAILQGSQSLWQIPASSNSILIEPCQADAKKDAPIPLAMQWSSSHSIWSYSRLAAQALSTSEADLNIDTTLEQQLDESLINSISSAEPMSADLQQVQSTFLGALQLGDLVHNCLALILSREITLQQALTISIESASLEGLSDRDHKLIQELVRATLAAPLFTKSKTILLQQLKSNQLITEMGFDLPIQQWQLADLNQLQQFEQLPLSRFQSRYLAQGLFSGFIDLVIDLPQEWLIVDYKTNNLGSQLSDYNQTAIHQCMLQHHYGWQGLFYALALRQWQRVHENPQKKPIRVVYLFCRGLDLALKQGVQTNIGVYRFGSLNRVLEKMTGYLKL